MMAYFNATILDLKLVVGLLNPQLIPKLNAHVCSRFFCLSYCCSLLSCWFVVFKFFFCKVVGGVAFKVCKK